MENGRRMKVKTVSGIMLTLLLVSMLTFAFNIQTVRASGTIYIRADGSVEPLTANITSADNVTYYFTDNNYDEIVVERDNIVVDGAGYTLQGTGSGIDLTGRSNVTIQNTNIQGFNYGIALNTASNNSIYGNSITNNYYGISLDVQTSYNIIYGNTIANNDYPFIIWTSNNIFYHNNIVDNTWAMECFGETNVWDDGYPSGGNYWNWGVDQYSGPYQNETGSDGISDIPLTIETGNRDRYPLMKPWSPLPIKVFDAVWEDVHYSVTTFSNSSLTHFIFNQSLAQISFKATGKSGTVGYCNVTIPNNLLWGDFTVLIDGDPPMELIRKDNATHISLYFTYELQSTRTVQIIGTEVIPEFPTWTPILLILILLSIAIAIYKRRILKTPIQ